MPIREYGAPADIGLRPSETGIQATAMAARRIQGAYNEAAASMKETAQDSAAWGRALGGTISEVGGVAVKAVEHQEVSKGAANLAVLHATATKAWNDQAKTADPNDETAGPKFLAETLQPALDKFKQGFMTDGGQKWAETRTSSFLDHMTQKIDADRATMAGHAIAVNLDQTKNALSTTVRSDPTSLDESLKLYESAVGHLVSTSPALNAVQASKIQTELLQHGKSEIVKSALIGLAQINPAEATKAVESGQYGAYISGADAKAIISNAKQQIRAERTDQTYQRHQSDLDKKDTSEVAENEWIKKLYSTDPSVTKEVSAKSIINDDRLTNTTKEKLVRMIEREFKAETPANISRETTTGLFERMRLPEGDPSRINSLDEIDKAFTDQKLTRQDHDWLRKEFLAARSPDGRDVNVTQGSFLRQMKPLIDKSNLLQGTVDDTGSAEYYKYMSFVQKKVAQYRKDGKDPYTLFDPGSADYLGKPETLAPFRKSLSESAADRGRTTAPDRRSTPPRRPGEKPDAYLKRIGVPVEPDEAPRL